MLKEAGDRVLKIIFSVSEALKTSKVIAAEEFSQNIHYKTGCNMQDFTTPPKFTVRFHPIIPLHFMIESFHGLRR